MAAGAVAGSPQDQVNTLKNGGSSSTRLKNQQPEWFRSKLSEFGQRVMDRNNGQVQKEQMEQGSGAGANKDDRGARIHKSIPQGGNRGYLKYPALRRDDSHDRIGNAGMQMLGL